MNTKLHNRYTTDQADEFEADESEPEADTVVAEEEPDDVEELAEPEEAQQADIAPEPADSEILGIFLEEATDILERCDSLLNTWRDDLSDLDIVQNLQREIHTFKGGARMASISALGTLSHAMESLLERIAGQSLAPSVSAIEVLEKGCDKLNVWTQQVVRALFPRRVTRSNCLICRSKP